MKTNYDIMLDFLQKNERARERRWKDEALIFLLKPKFPYLETTSERVEFCREYTKLDREWRRVMADHRELQTESYNDKEILEQERILELGYEVGSREREIKRII